MVRAPRSATSVAMALTQPVACASLECRHRRCIQREECVHAEVAALTRRSTTIVFAVCNRYALSNITLPRWRRYTELHGFDFLVVGERNKTVTGIATPAWDRAFIARALFRMGYLDVMHVDGDSAVLAWEIPVGEYVRSRTGPFANASDDAFLYVSQDRSRFGAYVPTARDFAQHISLHPNGQTSGPNNFGVWLMRNSPQALAALEHLISFSQTPGRRFQKFPAEQGVLNAWLGQNCSLTSKHEQRRSTHPRHSSCVYAQSRYGSFQRFMGRGDTPIPLMPQANWTVALNTALREYRDTGTFVLHTPSMSAFPAFTLLAFRMVEELFPIGVIGH